MTGDPLGSWRGLDYAPPPMLQGRYAHLARLSAADHAEALHGANLRDPAIWRFLPYGPFPSLEAYRQWVDGVAAGADPAFYAIGATEEGSRAAWSGVASLMRIDRTNGVIEIGHVNFAAPLQRTRAATEAMHLLMNDVFAAGFRRLEWKCNAANAASRRAALRLGFSYEGTFRQHMVVKGANRDTAWFAVLDADWPARRAAHLAWLDPANFQDGRQRRSLSDLVAALPVAPAG